MALSRKQFTDKQSKKKNDGKKDSGGKKNILDTAPPDAVISSSETDTSAAPPTTDTSAIPPTTKEHSVMEITFTRNDAKRRNSSVMYTADGRRGSVRISKTLFSEPPATLTLANDALAAAKIPAAKLSPEERKALRAARPKLTLVEKIAKREAALAKLKAKAATEAVGAL